MKVDTDYNIVNRTFAIGFIPDNVTGDTLVDEITVERYCADTYLILHLPLETLQQVFDALWQKGVRPTQEVVA